MQNMDLTELMKKSLAIPTGSIVCWPDQGCEQKLRPTTDEDEGVDFERAYFEHRRIILFVINGIRYVLPYQQDAERCLLRNGFKLKSMYVPFSNNGDYIKGLEEEWREIKNTYMH